MAKIVVQDDGRTWLADLPEGARLVVGRSEACDLPVRSERASRRHALIRTDGADHRVADLDSTNGTLLNGAPLQGERALCDRDVIVVGGATLLYRASGGPERG